jgi:hypothetical protein
MSDTMDDSDNLPCGSTLDLVQKAWLCSVWRIPSVHSFKCDDESGSDDLNSAGVEWSSGSNSPCENEVLESEVVDVAEEEDIDVVNMDANVVDNANVRDILQSADLHILQPDQFSLAYHSNKPELNLFHLLFTKTYLETVG